MWMTWRDMCSGPASHRAATTVAATTRCLKTATCHARCSVVAGCTWAHPAKLKVLVGSPSHRRYGASGPPRSPADFRSTCCAPEVRCPCWLVTGCHWAPGDGGFLRPRPLPLCTQPAAVLPFCVSPSAATPRPDVPHTRLTLRRKFSAFTGSRCCSPARYEMGVTRGKVHRAFSALCTVEGSTQKQVSFVTSVSLTYLLENGRHAKTLERTRSRVWCLPSKIY